jgi:hypothetical protein
MLENFDQNGPSLKEMILATTILIFLLGIRQHAVDRFEHAVMIVISFRHLAHSAEPRSLSKV